MILTQVKNGVERWLNSLVSAAIRDGISVYRYRYYRPETRPENHYQLRLRRKAVLSDQAQLNIGRAYIILTTAAAISAGLLGWLFVGFAIWFWGLVVPLVVLIWWRRRLYRA